MTADRLAKAVGAYFPAVGQARNSNRCSAEFLELQAAWAEAQSEESGVVDRVALAAEIAENWDAWLSSKDHLYQCIGYSEGQACCADTNGRQATLIDLALNALDET